jgi:hypothetical protein
MNSTAIDLTDVETLLKIGQALKVNFSREQLAWFTDPANMASIKPLVCNTGKVILTDGLVDLASPPTLFADLHSVISHEKGPANFDLNEVRIIISVFHPISFTERAFNANMLDYLLKHPERIPADFKKSGTMMLFSGTRYHDYDIEPCFRYLKYEGDELVQCKVQIKRLSEEGESDKYVELCWLPK